MPNKRAAYKSLRQNKKRRAHNKLIVSELRTLVKEARTLIAAKEREKANSLLKTLESKLCKAAKTNCITKNNASRRISRLRSQWSKIGA